MHGPDPDVLVAHEFAGEGTLLQRIKNAAETYRRAVEGCNEEQARIAWREIRKLAHEHRHNQTEEFYRRRRKHDYVQTEQHSRT